MIGLTIPRSITEALVLEVKEPSHIDARATELEAFFSRHHCPQPYYVTDYLNAADKYNIDFRLLPAISLLESTCGKHYRLNNYWGWNSARTGFVSVPSGIDFVAGQLATGSHYKNKTIDQKLRAWNPNPAYAGKVEGLMKEISNE